MGSPVMAKRSPACPVAYSTACDLVGRLLSGRPRKVTDHPCSACGTRLILLCIAGTLRWKGAPAQLHDLLKVSAYSVAERHPLPVHRPCCRGGNRFTQTWARKLPRTADTP